MTEAHVQHWNDWKYILKGSTENHVIFKLNESWKITKFD